VHTLSGDILCSGTMTHLMVHSVKETISYAAEQTKKHSHGLKTYDPLKIK